MRFGAEGGWKARVTSHPSVQEAVVKGGWEYTEDRVVLDGTVITSRGSVIYLPRLPLRGKASWANGYRPGTSLLFALTLVETLCGREKREVSPALAHRHGPEGSHANISIGFNCRKWRGP